MTRPASLLRASALALVFGATRAVAQDAVVDPFAKLDPASRYAIELMIDSAKTAGLPDDALRSRALEGIAKKADSKKIVTLVRTRLGHLRDARALLGPVGPDDLKAAAAVLEAGVKPEQLAPFKNPPPKRSLVAPLTVMGDLVTRGVPKDEASSAIVKLWQGGAEESDFMGLFHGVESDILQGLNPGAALRNRVRDFPGRAPLKTP